nr:integrase, catalytic region, zinc finger, CCHC-type, peptidase aspartic, catalytic [Tanacetum cinerariifolium]
MAAGSMDRPPMLAPRRYPQWRSRPNGEALRKCILSGPYKPTIVLVQEVDATDDSSAIPKHTTVKTPMNMSPANKSHFETKKEAIHLILTRIGDEIYSTVDACQTAQEIWEAIERLQQDKNITISELKKLIEKGKEKSVDTKFDKPFVVRQSNAQRIPKPSLLGVNHKTNVNRPHNRSNQLKDKVVPNNSQVKLKKTQAEVHPRIHSFSNKMKSVTACNDSFNSITLNANAVCGTCKKCLVDSNHFACVTKMLNDVNARTKKHDVIVQLIIFIVDSGCTKHMMCNLKLLCNFVENFLGTVHFGNDQFAPILGYVDLVQGNITVNRIYYVEGLNHNLFSVGQFCDANLEVAFQKSTCFVRNLQETSVANDTSGLVPQRQKALDYDNSDPIPQLHNVSFSADAHVPLQQELDILFGPLYDEFFNAGSNPQDTRPTMNIQPTSIPSTPTYVHVEENNDNQAEEEHLQDEFTNPLCAPAQEDAESSSHNVGNSNVPTFNQPQVSEYRWMKDHLLEQVCGNPSRPVQTRRQLATDLEMWKGLAFGSCVLSPVIWSLRFNSLRFGSAI